MQQYEQQFLTPKSNNYNLYSCYSFRLYSCFSFRKFHNVRQIQQVYYRYKSTGISTADNELSSEKLKEVKKSNTKRKSSVGSSDTSDKKTNASRRRKKLEIPEVVEEKGSGVKDAINGSEKNFTNEESNSSNDCESIVTSPEFDSTLLGLTQNKTEETKAKKIPKVERIYKSYEILNQYDKIKEQYKDYIVLFQVGDFYELYKEDALEVTSKTTLRLTTYLNEHMCGFPVRTLDEWSKSLTNAGFSLAVCNQNPWKQTEESRLCYREVVRVITPGTVLEPTAPDANYLLSIYQGPNDSLGLAWLDISTGNFYLSISTITDVAGELERINPAEILLAEDAFENVSTDHRMMRTKTKEKVTLKDCIDNFKVSYIPSSWFNLEPNPSSKNIESEGTYISLLEQNSNLSTIEKNAGSAVLKFVTFTQGKRTPKINSPQHFFQEKHMAIDINSRKSLEIINPLVNNSKAATLFYTMNGTVTAAGKRLLRARVCAPSAFVDVIQKRLSFVDFFYNHKHLADEVQKMLKNACDVERILQKIATGNGTLLDLQAVMKFIIVYGTVREQIVDNSDISSWPHFTDLLDAVDLENFHSLLVALAKAVGSLTQQNSQMMQSGYSQRADSLAKSIFENDIKTCQILADSYREKLNISSLKILPHKLYTRVIEIPRNRQGDIKSKNDFVLLEKISAKARYTSEDLQKMNEEYMDLNNKQTRLQYVLFKTLSTQVLEASESIRKMAESLAEIDVSSSLGLIARRRGYVKPEMTSSDVFSVQGGHHPVINQLQPDTFVSNDCSLDKNHIWIVSGPNMGGKSTFLRQNALITIMAQSGSFVPANKAKIGIVDRMFSRIGASDNLTQNQSTFMTEMSETAHILSNATSKSFVILDEIGRGTSVIDGISIAWSIVEYLKNVIGCRTLLSTHYSELSGLKEMDGIQCYHVTAEKTSDGITFPFKLLHGPSDKSFGIDIAQMAGVPLTIVERARTLQTSCHQKADCRIVMDELVNDKKVEKIKEEDVYKRDKTLEFLNEIKDINMDELSPKQAWELLHQFHTKLPNSV